MLDGLGSESNSINVQKVLWTLAELGLEYRRIDAGMKFGVGDTSRVQGDEPDRAWSPPSTMTAMCCEESNAIVRYLAVRHCRWAPSTPTDLQARFQAERWMDWQGLRLQLRRSRRSSSA